MTGTPPPLLKAAISRIACPHLFSAHDFALPSYLQRYFTWRRTPFFRRRQLQALLLYGLLVAFTLGAGLVGPMNGADRAFMAGLGAPGAGFLHWATEDQIVLAITLFVSALCAFAASLVVWFATGNLLAPLVTWLALAWLSGQPGQVGLVAHDSAHYWHLILAPLLYSWLGIAWLRAGKPTEPSTASFGITLRDVEVSRPADEMTFEDLQRIRLLLDRALQPADRFDGFEWRDQFQTAAVRYQVNFMAYSLALAQHRYAPAADAYFLEAQRRLMIKIGDHRVWRYWRWENAWGNFRFGADPIPRQNIMYAGFTALQMALGGHDDLVLHRKEREWRRHPLEAITRILALQYGSSPYGLLACEPHWIYPLCNLITMTGIKAADARLRTGHWHALSDQFLESLHREATHADGRFIAFRTALTGMAPPAPGGIVMQAFPCLFLNALCPAQARQHWERVRGTLETGSWRRLFWMVDVGNYGFSRASSYAATAAAAVELGDGEVAARCLAALEASCASRTDRGVTHRERASLWAHALELTARFGGENGLRRLTDEAPKRGGPRLVHAPYPQVLIARARAAESRLELVLDRGGTCSAPQIEVGGLAPGRPYRTGHDAAPFFRADPHGRAVLRIPIEGRTRLTIEPLD